MGCSVTSADSNFDTSWFAAAIELDGTVRNFNFPIGDSMQGALRHWLEIFKQIYKNTWRNKIFETNIFMTRKVIPKFMKILSHTYLEPYRIHFEELTFKAVVKSLKTAKYFVLKNFPLYGISMHENIKIVTEMFQVNNNGTCTFSCRWYHHYWRCSNISCTTA